jgi:hypothetical protein
MVYSRIEYVGASVYRCDSEHSTHTDCTRYQLCTGTAKTCTQNAHTKKPSSLKPSGIVTELSVWTLKSGQRRTRTDTLARMILSQLRLPIPPVALIYSLLIVTHGGVI